MGDILCKENRDSLLVVWAIIELLNLLTYVAVKDVDGFKTFVFGLVVALITLVLYIAMGRYR